MLVVACLGLSLPFAACAAGPMQARAPGERPCMRLLRPVARGQAFVAADLRGERCPRDVVLQRTHHDRGMGLVRAPIDLATGEAIAPIASTLLAEVRQGEKLAIVYRDGPIRISRSGVAARDSKAGTPVRLAFGDGAIVAARSWSASSPVVLMEDTP